ncbi:tetratricopeptide repeat protein [Croceivirga thetidis]|uniref:Tetratricopeptide repeat protein n=1 Tax=Croceivirga thetidis TaxID=2721623 RepID=A0ABX1GPW7_9FLAO|nr:tetratricopeptide repeat protein [Croceivirga thetidis]NKI31966.1 tetratricopeptide repeat protein [Croceivirga thetidis]
MKTRILVMLAFSFSLVAFAQKNEVKAAEKAMKSGDAAMAKASLEAAASTIDGADSKIQAQYYAVLGDAQAKLSEFGPAIESYKKVLSIEEASGKAKYSADINQKMQQMSADLVNAAVDDNNNKSYTAGAEKLYMAYQLRPQDTIYLYFAASSAVNGKDYPNALKYYNELKDLNYDGSEVKYSAVNIETGEEEEMDKTSRDLYVKAGTHKDPKEKTTPSKRPEIIKNIALIYQQEGDNEKALAAYDDAIASNPDDVNLLLNKANLYYSMGDKDKFKEIMGQAAVMAPDNPDLHYNVGVINMEQGNMEEARAAYKRALEIDPNYINATLNLSTSYVNEGNNLIDTMNELALSNKRADIAKYDELKAQKDNLFKEGAAILEAALKTTPEKESVLEQLRNIYGALGDNENFMRIKKLMGE